MEKILDEDFDEIQVANTNADVWIKFSEIPKDYKYAMARTIGVKSHVS